jgi:hypothetical protein
LTSTVGLAGETVYVRILVTAILKIIYIPLVDGDIRKGYVSAVKEVTRISVEEVLQMKDCGESHRI